MGQADSSASCDFCALMDKMESSTQESGEDQDDRITYPTSPCKDQVHHAASKGQDRLECENVSALNLSKTSQVQKLKSGNLKRLVENLVPAFYVGDFSFITRFLSTYRDLATTQEVLDLLFMQYGCILPYTEGDGGPADHLRKAISFILSTWLYNFSEDFCQPPDFPCLNVLVAYIRLNLPGSQLEQVAQLLLTQHEQEESIQRELEVPPPEPGLQPAHELELPAASPLAPDQDLRRTLESALPLVLIAAQELE